MNYERMICWLIEDDEKRLINANINNIPIVYTHSKEEFTSQISSDTYNVFSFCLAEDDNTELQGIMDDYPNYKFHLFAIYEGNLTIPEADLMDENEERFESRVYLTEELINDYLSS